MCLVLLAAALVAPPARAAERYVDEVFGSVTTTTNVVYGQAPNSSGEQQVLKLEISEPTGDTELFRPVLIFGAGGYFKRLDLNTVRSIIVPYYVRRGWVVINPVYRIRPELPEGWPNLLLTPDVADNVDAFLDAVRDAQHDIQAAVRWVRRNAVEHRLDAGRVAVGGQSAGALTALAVAFNHDEGPGESGNPGYPSVPTAVVSHAGAYGPGIEGMIEPGDPPVAILHGTHDTVVPYATGVLPCAVTTAVLNICEHTPFVGAEHGLSGTCCAEASDFLLRYVVRAPRAATAVSLDAAPDPLRVAEPVVLRATLTAAGVPLAEGVPLEGKRVTFAFGSERMEVVTGPAGDAEATFTPAAAGSLDISATFSGEQTTTATTIASGSGYAGSRATASVEVAREGTVLTYEGETRPTGETVNVAARLLQDDGAPIFEAAVTFEIKGERITVSTDEQGLATAGLAVPDHGRSQEVVVTYPGDDSYEPARTSATVTWGGTPK